eukprot:m.303442 g.303442  ORF g.303442 m.303442 type:complete len:779 (+) comp15893_c0_seq5:229-2565(+)
MRRSRAPSQRGRRPSSAVHLERDTKDGKPFAKLGKGSSLSTSGGGGGSSGGSVSSTLASSSAASLEHEATMARILKKPFKVPIPGYQGGCGGRTGLGVRKLAVRQALHDPNEEGAVILYTPPTLTAAEQANPEIRNKHPVHVVVDPIVGRKLRPHQVEGVQFLWNSVTGKQVDGHFGCIMADEMGLGKTFQCVTLLWTLLRQGSEAQPTVSRGIVVCPSSLVKNWYNEFFKWLGQRVQPMAMDGGKKEDIIKKLERFIAPVGRVTNPVLVISYETLRLYADILCKHDCGIVICDEGHRLKNCASQTYIALSKLRTKRRIILTGTPVQNELLEYYSLVEFCNPGLLGSSSEFRKRFENHILRGRDGDATDKEIEMGAQKLKEMAAIVNRCVIRRTNSILSKYLPPKVEQLVCCKLTPLQTAMYQRLIQSKVAAMADKQGAAFSSLAFITNLKKLCNHPALIYGKIEAGEPGFSDLADLVPGSAGAAGGKRRGQPSFEPALSGKMMVLDKMLAIVKATTDDKVVLVSNYTQTLDLFQDLCRLRSYQYVRLDGTMAIKKRQRMVDRFNDPTSSDFIFMLSSKAGGCGLNLIGANRLVMFDPDWNPANDEQAMARVWRDGQRKLCFVYRMVSTGSIEEKIFQRQAHKKALSECVVDEAEDVERHFTRDDLRDLFVLKNNTRSDTHDQFKCRKCSRDGTMSLVRGQETVKGVVGNLAEWDHYPQPKFLKDSVLREAAGDIVSFVFRAQSHEGMLKPTAKTPPKEQEEEEEDKAGGGTEGGKED